MCLVLNVTSLTEYFFIPYHMCLVLNVTSLTEYFFIPYHMCLVLNVTISVVAYHSIVDASLNRHS